MKVEIRKNRYGINAGCLICGRRQDGWMPHPLVVYHKADNEKRGHNEPICSNECAERLVEKLKTLGYWKGE